MEELERYERNTEDDEPISIVNQDPRGGFLQLVGLAPAAAALAVAIDTLLFAEDLVSAGLLLPLSAIASAALGYCTYRLQLRWGDSQNSAKFKGVVIGILTVIPVPLTVLISLPMGLAGVIRNALARS